VTSVLVRSIGSVSDAQAVLPDCTHWRDLPYLDAVQVANPVAIWIKKRLAKGVIEVAGRELDRRR
jgi:hypothetical protein